MSEEILLFVAGVFLLAGAVKGVIGMGLPTISMGLLALVLSPLEAAAILVIPSFATNVWQMLAGPHLASMTRRLALFLVGVCTGTWAGAGLMSGAGGRLGQMLLGLALAAYALSGLLAVSVTIDRRREPWLGPLVGAATGLITAATGVFVVPAVPYLAGLGLGRDELVQALGLAFSVSTAALAVNLVHAAAITPAIATPVAIGFAMAFAGMWAGQALRRRLSPEHFRRVFLWSLLVLGAYLAARGLRG